MIRWWFNLDNKLWYMRLSVEQQIGSFILNGTEAIVYLYNELIPTAWLSDSILLVILPFANFDSVTQGKSNTSPHQPGWKSKDGI